MAAHEEVRTRSGYEQMTREELKAILRRGGKKVGGNKTVLIDRILAEVVSTEQQAQTEPVELQERPSSPRASPRPASLQRSPRLSPARSPKFSRAELEAMTVVQLKKILEQAGIQFWRRSLKADLVNLILTENPDRPPVSTEFYCGTC